MRRARRPWVLVALAALALGAEPAPAAAQSGVPAEVHAKEEAHATKRVMEQEEAARRRRATPAAKAARQRSRAAYRGMSAAEAAGLARNAFPHAVEGGTTALGNDGTAVRGHLGDRTALIEEKGGARAVAVSQLPLRTPAGVPVDLSLLRTDSGFAPKAPLVPLDIGGFAGDGVKHESGLAVAPVGAGRLAGQAVADAVLFANLRPDTDYVVKPLMSGVELSWMLRSPSSPEVFMLKMTLAQGQTLINGRAGGLEVREGGDVVARLLPPAAIDAQDKLVRSEMTLLSDGVVKISMPHRDQDLAYPILLDPPLISSDGQHILNHWNGYNNFSNWSYADASGRYWVHRGYGNEGNGLYMGGHSGQCYNDGVSAAWYWRHPDLSKTTYVNRVDFNGLFSDNWGEYFTDLTLYNDRDGAYRAFDSFSQPWHLDANGRPQTNHSTYAWSPGASLVQFGWRSRSTCTPRHHYLNEAVIYLTDPEAPTLRSVAHTGAANVWTRGGAVGSTVNTDDPGIGIYSARVRNTTQLSLLDQTAWHGCQAHPNAHPCPGSWQKGFSYNTSTWPEGLHTLAATSSDVLHSSGDWNWSIKLDRTAPGIALSGALAGANDQWVPPGSYRLDVRAEDGDPATNAPALSRRSGVVRVEIDVDGSRVRTSTQSCTVAHGSCPLTTDWSFVTSEWPGGDHEIVVRAVDALGHTSTSTLTVYTSDDEDPQREYWNPPQQGGYQTAAAQTMLALCPLLVSCAHRTDDMTSAVRAEGGLAGNTSSSMISGEYWGPASPSGPRWGISDNNGSTFGDARFAKLGLKRARLIAPYDVVINAIAPPPQGTDPAQHYQQTVEPASGTDTQRSRLRRVDRWMNKVCPPSSSGSRATCAIEPLVSLDYTLAADGTNKAVPPLERYREAFRAFQLRYPFVKLFSAWNEANLFDYDRPDRLPLGDEPFYHGQLWQVADSECHPSGQRARCLVIAGTFLGGHDLFEQRPWKGADGQPGAPRSYLAAYAEGMNHGRSQAILPPAWGYHAYSDGNRLSDELIAAFINATAVVSGGENKASNVWLTEQGGAYRIGGSKYEVSNNTGLARQMRAIRYLIGHPDGDYHPTTTDEGVAGDNGGVVSRYARITRFYMYQWRAGDINDSTQLPNFDSGLLTYKGAADKVRRGYFCFRHRVNPLSTDREACRSHTHPEQDQNKEY